MVCYKRALIIAGAFLFVNLPLIALRGFNPERAKDMKENL
jgi:hypothetical protein